MELSKESRKKALLLMAGPLRGGGGVKGLTIKEKITFFKTFYRYSDLNGLIIKNKLIFKLPYWERVIMYQVCITRSLL